MRNEGIACHMRQIGSQRCRVHPHGVYLHRVDSSRVYSHRVGHVASRPRGPAPKLICKACNRVRAAAKNSRTTNGTVAELGSRTRVANTAEISRNTMLTKNST